MLEVIGYMVIWVFFALLLPVLKAWAESKDTWVELTSEQLSALAEEFTGADGLDEVDFGRAVMAKYREMNT